MSLTWMLAIEVDQSCQPTAGDSKDGRRAELFNLAEDPFESKNLATGKPDQLRVMMRGLIASLEQTNALYPVDKTDGGAPLKPKLP